MTKHKIHTHPALESVLNLPPGHIVIDREFLPLLLAAPDLLEALRKIEIWSRDGENGTLDVINDTAKQAIAKTAGE
jgi:hypothetical protein